MLTLRLYDDDLAAIKAGRAWCFVPKRLAPTPGTRVGLTDLAGRATPYVRTVGNCVADRPGINQDWALLELTS